MHSYTLSSPGGGALGTDDQMKVYLNGIEIFRSSNTASIFAPVSFNAKRGDLLRVTGEDTQAGYIAMSELWLSSGGKQKFLSTGVPGQYIGSSVAGVFFDETYVIDLQPELEDDEVERQKKKAGPCPTEAGASAQFAGQVTDLVANSAGADLSYTSANANEAPASMGYGWSMGILQARLAFPASGDLVFYDGSGSFERWVLDGGNYVPAHPNNYIKAQQNVGGTYTLTFRDRTRMNFNASGQLTTVLDRNDNTTTFTRNGSGHVTTVDDGEGRTLHIGYGSRTDGQPTSLRRENATTGIEVQLLYDGNDRLWKLVEPEGETTEFLYNADGRLWKKIDPRGQVEVEYTYYTSGDHEGKKHTETRYGERLLTFTYTADTVTQVDEDLSTLSEDAPRTTVFTFRERGQLVRKEDELGNIWEWEYDDLFNPYLMTMAIDPNLNTTKYTYNSDGLLVSMEDAQANVTTYAYNQPADSGFTEAKRYLLKSIQRPTVTVGGSPVNYTPTRFYYDSLGNLIEVKDALNQSTLLDRRSDGRIETLTNRRGQNYLFGYSVQGSGLNAGNLTSVTAPAGPNSAPARQTNFSYDAYDRLTQVELDSKTVQFQFDDNDRLTRQTDPRGKYVDFAFDDGLLDYIDLPTNQGSGSTRRRTRFTYDNSSRMLQALSKTGTSSEQMRVRYEYDGFSNLRKLARLKDASEVVHQFHYDELDRLISALDPLSRPAQVAHAPFCTQRTVTTPRGIATTYSYDSLCRMVQLESAEEKVQYTYDELGRPTTIAKTRKGVRYGQIDSTYGSARYASNATRTTLLAYDELDRITQITYPDAETVLYEYDEEGFVTQITDTHGAVTRYTYYNDGRLYQVILERPSQSDRVFTYSYDAAGRMSQIDYPAGTNLAVKFSGPSNEIGWDDAGNLLHLRYLLNNSHLHRFAYTYDDSGNRISMVDTPTNTANAITWEYGYDWLNRLIYVSRNSTPTAVYTYDESDNRLSLQWPHLSETYEYVYDAANQITQRKLGGSIIETFSHDDDGNMTSRTAGGSTTRYRWSDQNHLLARKVDATFVERTKYDASGLRETRDDGTKYFRTGYTSLSDLRPSNLPVSYIQGHQLLGMEIDGTFYYYVTDALANVRLVLNASGSIVASTAYDEFGRAESTTGDIGLRPHAFQGALGVRNDDNGLYLAGHRWFDPALGRWLNPDPIGFAGGLNLFAGLGNSPVSRVDPDGLEPIQLTKWQKAQIQRSTELLRSMGKLSKALEIESMLSDDLIKVDQGLDPLSGGQTGASGIVLRPEDFQTIGYGPLRSNNDLWRDYLFAELLLHEVEHWLDIQRNVDCTNQRHQEIYDEVVDTLKKHRDDLKKKGHVSRTYLNIVDSIVQDAANRRKTWIARGRPR